MSNVIPFSHAPTGGGVPDSSKVVFTVDAYVLQQPRNDSWLLSAVEDTSFEGYARSIWTHHPNLKTSTRKFASYITPYWPMKNGKPLLQHSVMGAVCNAIEAMTKSEEITGRLVGIYLDSLVMGMADVARLVIYGTDKDGQKIRWDYFSESLSEWANINNLLTVQAVVSDVEPNPVMVAGLRMHMLSRITHPLDAGYVAKYAGVHFKPDTKDSNWGGLA